MVHFLRKALSLTSQVLLSTVFFSSLPLVTAHAGCSVKPPSALLILVDDTGGSISAHRAPWSYTGCGWIAVSFPVVRNIFPRLLMPPFKLRDAVLLVSFELRVYKGVLPQFLQIFVRHRFYQENFQMTRRRQRAVSADDIYYVRFVRLLFTATQSILTLLNINLAWVTKSYAGLATQIFARVNFISFLRSQWEALSPCFNQMAFHMRNFGWMLPCSDVHK